MIPRALLRRPRGRAAFAVAAALLVSACGEAPTAGTPIPDPPRGLPRPLSATESELVVASNAFAFELFRRAAAPTDSNVLLSPLSVSVALGMTMNGAAGATLDSMRLALGLSGRPLDQINAGYRSLIDLLRGLDSTTDFRIANSIWLREGIAFSQSFLEASRTSFDAEVATLDFDAPSSVTTINDWVSNATAGRIDRIVSELSGENVILLLNAIYFKGSWRFPFPTDLTAERSFAAVGGTQTVPMMRGGLLTSRLSTDAFDAVDLPYGNEAFAMTVILPKLGVGVHDVVESLTALRWAAWTQQFQREYVPLHLPRFGFEYSRRLVDDLSAMGMRVAFDTYLADLRPMTTTGVQLFISDVGQKTVVNVNEAGTEAAAATASFGSRTGGPPPLVVDRPFIFVIRERLSGTILFIGKVVRIPS